MVRTRYYLLTLAVLIIAGCATPGSPAYQASNWTTPLAALGITATPESLDRAQDWTVHQAVYDVYGSQGPAPVEGVDPPDSVVLADLQGPGCVLRIWAAQPAGVLHLYVDSGTEPVMVAALADVLAGRIKPFEAIGSYNVDAGFTAVPIPYKESCRLVLTGASKPSQVQVSYATFAPDTYLNSFRPKLGAEDRRYFAHARAAWAGAREVRFYDRDTETYHKTKRQLWPSEDVQVWVMDGPGTITELEMQLSANDPDILNKVWISIFWDGQTEPAISAPVGSFYGGAIQGGPDYGDPALGHNAGRMWFRFPMPFKQNAQIRMTNHSNDKVELGYGITWRPGDGGNGRRLHALHRQGSPQAGQPFEAAHVTGNGRFVGSVLQVSGADPAGIDAKAFVMADGANAYEPAALLSYYGNSALPMASEHGGLTMARTAITDSVPFQSDMAVLYEVPANAPVTLSSTVFWYQMN